MRNLIRSPLDTLEGCYHLPRFIDKTRLNLQQRLPEDYRKSFCHPKGLDSVFLTHFRIAKESLIAVIARAATDEEIGEWFKGAVDDFATRKAAWIEIGPKLGLPGYPMHDVLQWAFKNVYTECHDPAIDTVFKVLDWDEGRSKNA
jgi:hypothetical protein